jgi:hypothetical protein
MRRVAPLAALPLPAGCGLPYATRDDEAGSFDREHSTMTAAGVRRFGEFPLYWLGERFEGWNQVKPLCAQLDVAAHHGAWKRFRVRGAPLGGEPHQRILFTADAQVRVFANRGTDPHRPDRAFAALVSANQVGPRIGPGDAFPPAPLAVLAGEEACT